MNALWEKISIDPKICHGKPTIRGTRIMIYQILDLLADGISIDEIISEDYFPDLTKEDVWACIDYANHLVKNEDVLVYADIG